MECGSIMLFCSEECAVFDTRTCSLGTVIRKPIDPLPTYSARSFDNKLVAVVERELPGFDDDTYMLMLDKSSGELRCTFCLVGGKDVDPLSVLWSPDNRYIFLSLKKKIDSTTNELVIVVCKFCKELKKVEEVGSVSLGAVAQYPPHNIAWYPVNHTLAVATGVGSKIKLLDFSALYKELS